MTTETRGRKMERGKSPGFLIIQGKVDPSLDQGECAGNVGRKDT